MKTSLLQFHRNKKPKTLSTDERDHVDAAHEAEKTSKRLEEVIQMQNG